MSDFMLLGILRMPIEADSNAVAFTQFRSSAREAANRIEALTAERDAAYANGYSDAETEINQSVLGLENTFLHSQYADAKLRIEDLQAQTMRLSGMVHDLKKEVAISDALLISEAEVSLERLARAEAAEAERDRLRAVLSEADRRIVWEAVGFGNDFADQVQAVLKGEAP